MLIRHLQIVFYGLLSAYGNGLQVIHIEYLLAMLYVLLGILNNSDDTHLLVNYLFWSGITKCN